MTCPSEVNLTSNELPKDNYFVRDPSMEVLQREHERLGKDLVSIGQKMNLWERRAIRSMNIKKSSTDSTSI